MVALFAHRALLQEAAKAGTLAFDVSLMAASGFVFGAQSEKVEPSSLSMMVLWLGIGLQLVVAVSSLRVFSPERVVFWRECARGSGMALSPSAYFLGKDLVQLPRLALMVLAFLVPFYTLAMPTPSFPYYFLVFYLLAYTVSGYTYVTSVLCPLKDAQLLIVVTVLVLTMLAPPSETLYTSNKTGITRILTWLAPVRWAGEALFTAQTRRLSHAWKMPPLVYEKPWKHSALYLLYRFPFHEGWLRDVVTREKDGVCFVKGKWLSSDALNLPILLSLGMLGRVVALALLTFSNRGARGEAPLWANAAEACEKRWPRSRAATKTARWVQRAPSQNAVAEEVAA